MAAKYMENGIMYFGVFIIKLNFATLSELGPYLLPQISFCAQNVSTECDIT